MSNFGLRSFALGMMGEVNTLGKLALGEGFSPSMGTDFGQATQAMQPQQPMQQQPQQAPAMPAAPSGVNPQAWGILNNLQSQFGPLNVISSYRDPEHNARVGGAKHSRHMEGDAFDIDVRNMSREQRLALVEQARAAGFGGVGVYDNSLHFDMGPTRAWGPNYRSDSIPDWAREAVGSAQRGGDATRSSRGANGEIVPYGGDDASVDVSELEEIAGDVDTGMGRRQSALFGFFKGLGQMSRGEQVDISDVMESYYQRQKEASQRLMEISRERRRQVERQENRAQSVSDANVGLQNQLAAEYRAEDRDIRAEGRVEERDIREEDRIRARQAEDNRRLADSIKARFPDQPYIDEIADMIVTNPSIGTDFLKGDIDAALNRATKLWESENIPTDTVRTRQTVANLVGLTENDPGYEQYMLTGQFGDDDQSAKEAAIARLMETTVQDGSKVSREQAIRLVDGRDTVTENGQVVDAITGEVKLVGFPTDVAGIPQDGEISSTAANTDISSNLGVEGVYKSAINAITDFFHQGARYPEQQKANAALNTLKTATIFNLTEPIAGRQSNWTMQQVERMMPGATAGPDGALTAFTQLKEVVDNEIVTLNQDILSQPQAWATTPEVLTEARTRVNSLNRLSAMYDDMIAGLEIRNTDRPPLESFRR